jgi:hypothetical protein
MQPTDPLAPGYVGTYTEPAEYKIDGPFDSKHCDSDIEKLKKYQANSSWQAQLDLFTDCYLKFENASRLLEIWPSGLFARDSIQKSAVLNGLDPLYDEIAKRYRETIYDPQMTLLQTNDGLAIKKWVWYWDDDVRPWLVAQHDVVREILRATGALPSESMSRARRALIARLAELSLPQQSDLT